MTIQQETEKYKFVCRLEQMNGGLKSDRNHRTLQKNTYYSGYLIVYKK
jgi:hypothetical protein